MILKESNETDLIMNEIKSMHPRMSESTLHTIKHYVVRAYNAGFEDGMIAGKDY